MWLPRPLESRRRIPGERAAGGVEADRVRRLVAVARQRRCLRRPRDRGRPAERRRYEVVHGQPRPRPLLPHRRHREPHQLRERLTERLRVERSLVTAPVLDEQVRLGEQLAEALVVRFAREVERDHALPGVVPGRLDGDTALAKEGGFVLKRVAPGRNHAHDIGAAVGE